MRVFLSYPSEDRRLAESIFRALRAQRHTVFFDRANLPPGEEYDARIREAIDRAHLVVFLVSPEALEAGSYTLAELDLAQRKWAHPAGKLLPVVVRPVGFDRIPPYLKSVTLLEPQGNVVAATAAAVHRITRARRRSVVTAYARGLALACVVAASGYVYWMSRPPSAEATGKDGAPAVLVPAGSYIMGDDVYGPRREVYVDAFYFDTYEVTTSRYANFLQASRSVNPPDQWAEADPVNAAELPVIGVDWQDSDAYCRWAGRRLPTEAEWEKAARGTDGRVYPWGNQAATADRANFLGDNALSAYAGGLAPVGSHTAGMSPYGAQDMGGNAAEWVLDWFTGSLPSADVRNPKGPESGTQRVIRGGGWDEPGDRMIAARRFSAPPDQRAEDTGFRCARDGPGS